MDLLSLLQRRGREPPLLCRQQLCGRTLMVDCSACAGAGSLGDGRCLQAFLVAVPSHASFQLVVLRRLVEVRYQSSAATMLKGAADLVREFEDMHPLRSRSCRRCPNRPAAAALRTVLARWGYPSSLPLRTKGKKCADCADIAKKVALEVEDRLQSIESKALAETLIVKEG